MQTFRAFSLALFVLAVGAIWQPAGSMACVGAMAAQERKTPPGEWCQRAVPQMSPKAHACTCHQHDCDVDPNDDNNRSAHTDPQCLNYCTVSQCMCEKMDCP